MCYPITLTRAALVEADACSEGLAPFDEVALDGTLVIANVGEHAALLATPLAPYEAWAIKKRLLPPITMTAGHHGTAVAGHHGTAKAGDYGTATAGPGGIAVVGVAGTAAVGSWASATAGLCGTAVAGYCGKATAGEGGTATVGGYGAAKAGDHGTATAGAEGTAAAGVGGVLMIWHYDGRRRRLVVGYVGKAGILPNVPYKLNAKGRFVPVATARRGAP